MEPLNYTFQFVRDVHVKIIIKKSGGLEEGLLHKKRTHNTYLLSQNRNYKIKFEKLSSEIKDDL